MWISGVIYLWSASCPLLLNFRPVRLQCTTITTLLRKPHGLIMWNLPLIPSMFTCLCSLEAFCCDRLCAQTECHPVWQNCMDQDHWDLIDSWTETLAHVHTLVIFSTPLRVEGTQGRKEIKREDVWSSCHNNPSYQCSAFSPPSSCVCPPHTFSTSQVDTSHTPYS